MSHILSLIKEKEFDCIGWVPTIKGALSLSLTNNAGPIFGEVDRYTIYYKHYTDSASANNCQDSEERFLFEAKGNIAATSVQTVIDGKLSKEYQRSFRYIFHGTISKENNSDSEGLLRGKLYILLIKDNHFSKKESEMLSSFDTICKMNDSYKEAFEVVAESMDDLEKRRQQLNHAWDELLEKIEGVKNYWETCNHRIKEAYCQRFDLVSNDGELSAEGWDLVTRRLNPLFCFDVVLSRDGIILLKNESSTECKKLFADSNTADDYEHNIPIHRLFKMAMNYVKYLFHSNYHHNETHDSFLPASNLHPLKHQSGSNYFLTPAFRHQLDSFLTPVALCKRKQFSDYDIDCMGVLLYAQTFVNVFKNNDLIDKEYAKSILEYIETQKKEVEYMTQKHRSMITSFISKSGIFGALAAISAATVAFLRVIDPFREEYLSSYARWKLSLMVFLLTLLAYMFESAVIRSKQFHIIKPQNSRMWRNSDLYYHTLSSSYRFWINLNKLRNRMNVGYYFAVIVATGCIIWGVVETVIYLSQYL